MFISRTREYLIFTFVSLFSGALFLFFCSFVQKMTEMCLFKKCGVLFPRNVFAYRVVLSRNHSGGYLDQTFVHPPRPSPTQSTFYNLGRFCTDSTAVSSSLSPPVCWWLIWVGVLSTLQRSKAAHQSKVTLRSGVQI